jgi:hypothetical protein
VVYDYKARNAPDAAKWVAERSFQVALYMRVASQLLGVETVGGFYQPLAGRDLRARGALDAGAGVHVEHVRSDELEREQLDALLHELLASATQAAHEARAGALQSRPQSCTPAGVCAYPTICRCER